MSEQESREGHPDAYQALDRAWYAAVERLHDCLGSDDNETVVKAAKVLLDFYKSFSVLGGPFVPARALKEEEEEEDDA